MRKRLTENKLMFCKVLVRITALRRPSSTRRSPSRRVGSSRPNVVRDGRNREVPDLHSVAVPTDSKEIQEGAGEISESERRRASMKFKEKGLFCRPKKSPDASSF